MNDLSLRQDILDELEFQPNIDAVHIGVAVENGVVTLTGHVTNYAQKIAAERAVKSVKGVRAIAEEVDVRFPSDFVVADDTIASRTLDVISWNTEVPDDRIKVRVQAGWVTLEGEVDWQFQKEATERAVRKLSGVKGVTNLLTLKARVNAADVQRKIEDALKRNAAVEAHGIHVKVTGGTVRLEGKVHLWLERQAAEQAAWSVPGVYKVEDKLTIG
jgi:osmotically-inducible protein OsmY